MYDSSYDENSPLELCEEPEYGALHGTLEWDDGNISHVDSNKRISWREVEAGVARGYLYLEPDPEDCRFRYLFRVSTPLEFVPPTPLPIYRLIIDTSQGTLRPVTWFEETNEANIRTFKKADKEGDLE